MVTKSSKMSIKSTVQLSTLYAVHCTLHSSQFPVPTLQTSHSLDRWCRPVCCKHTKYTTQAPTRQCEFKDIKLCQVKIKFIALGWYWVTMIFLGQINPKIHYSPGMHNVQVITKKKSYKSVKASWKWTIFGSFMVQFLWITCFCSHISLKNLLHAHTLHTFLTSSAF